MSAVDRAYVLARAALAPHLPNRWLHVQGVASLARRLAGILVEVDGETLVQAAWLHDVGYSPNIADCGFHPLDGARYLTAAGVAPTVVSLVAHHSAAAIEARIRGLNGLAAYPDEPSPTRDALWYCDALVGPRGQRWSASERWNEVRQRYGPTDVVTKFLDSAEPSLRAAVERTEQRINAAK